MTAAGALALVVPGRDATGAAGHVVVEGGYRLPQAHVRAAPATSSPSAPTSSDVWLGRLSDLAVPGTTFGALIGILLSQDQLARR